MYYSEDGITYDEIYIKALDSMPVGTIVDFDGEESDIPTGWEEVSDNSKVVLYNNDTGTNGSITLSESASNFSYLMVYWKSTWNSTRQGCAIAPPSSYKWSLFETVVGSGSDNGTYTNIAIYYIGGTQFDLDKAKNYNGQNDNVFYITKIVGYK